MLCVALDIVIEAVCDRGPWLVFLFFFYPLRSFMLTEKRRDGEGDFTASARANSVKVLHGESARWGHPNP